MRLLILVLAVLLLAGCTENTSETIIVAPDYGVRVVSPSEGDTLTFWTDSTNAPVIVPVEANCEVPGGPLSAQIWYRTPEYGNVWLYTARIAATDDKISANLSLGFWRPDEGLRWNTLYVVVTAGDSSVWTSQERYFTCVVNQM
jgi:hypothetical protein